MSRKRKAMPPDSDWARKAVDGMSDAEVRRWCAQLGVETPPPADTRTPIERMVDEACGRGKP